MPAWTQSAAFLNGIMANARLTFNEAFARNAPDVRVPEYLTQWLGRLRLLYGVPFTNLVPHSMLLPKESIRFFYVDRNWTDWGRYRGARAGHPVRCRSRESRCPGPAATDAAEAERTLHVSAKDDGRTCRRTYHAARCARYTSTA